MPDKICESCGRRFAWRKKWERDWDRVRYCSSACRARGSGGRADQSMEETILSLLEARRRGASICPSEAARAVDPDGWKALMEEARRAGRRLAARGAVEFTQQGRVVNASVARGPVRIRLTGGPGQG
ncbi:MAG: DUF2256 and DUF3253 domain-containing protein [Planctomycetes bacterium]|nr:DUF2256 and DUF3253 domain-containing protein [Planctomycetota bacterium]